MSARPHQPGNAAPSGGPPAAMPDAVAETARFLHQRGLWFRLARNPPVRSCREAASRRQRLGMEGIPLRDELRSYLAEGFDAGGQRRTVLLHCRGDRKISFERLGALNLGLSSITKADLSLPDSPFSYGLVNPFISEEKAATLGLALQVFDPSLIDDPGETGTMMTNAGSLTWSVEFEPSALVHALVGDNGLIAPIARQVDHGLPIAQRTIGILTGNGPESGALLWAKINAEVRRRAGEDFAGDISYPRVLISSLPAMGWSMELAERSELLWGRIADELKRLSEGGAQTIALACNTTQYYQDRIDRLLEQYDGRFIRLSTTIERWLERRSASVYILGIGEVVSTSQWSAFPFLSGNPRVCLPDGAATHHIEELAYRVKRHGADSIGLQKFRRIVRQASSDDILLLLTEFSVLFDHYAGSVARGRRIVDGVDLYAAAIVDSIMN